MNKKESGKKEGMRYPPLNNLVAKAHNKYELVLAASKRARELVDGEVPYVSIQVDNPISIATEEIEEGFIILENPALDEKNEEITEDEATTLENTEETDSENS